MKASDLNCQHIGRKITAKPVRSTIPVTGVIRWITLTSDEVVVAIEESEDDSAQEYTLQGDAEIYCCN